MSATARCVLCDVPGGELVWQGAALRIVLADEPDFPGFTRVVWQSHVAEMTELAAADRQMLMDAVWTVEAAMRRVLAPDKVNLASLGNAVPHLHWHVVPRWAGDLRFPGSPWSAVRSGAFDARSAAAAVRQAALRQLPTYRRALIDAFGADGASGEPGTPRATIG